MCERGLRRRIGACIPCSVNVMLCSSFSSSSVSVRFRCDEVLGRDILVMELSAVCWQWGCGGWSGVDALVEMARMMRNGEDVTYARRVN